MTDIKSASEKRRRKSNCEYLYIMMKFSVAECSKAVGVCDKTVYKWIKKGNWKAQRDELHLIEKEVKLDIKSALREALKRFLDDPKNKELTKLINLLKQFREESKPPLAYKDNIIRLLDHSVDFFLTYASEDFTNTYKSFIHRLAEYLWNRY